MNKTFDQGREEIAKLCRYFADNRQAFLAPGIKEAHVRLSLIDPLFEALGWDLRNTAMVAPQYREVVTEDSLDIEGQQKAPDYAFRVGTLSKFYTEAKKCGININADPGPAYQLRRYGWSARVPLSILTDFEEFGVYDCSLRPKPLDKASFGRIHYFKSEEYPDRWRELWDIFSREAVWAGEYDRYAASKRKRGTSEVDSEFLKEIEGWRDSLARNIAMRNLYLGYDDLNTAVQRTIDRIIFLRMAEDRGSESYGQLLKLCERPGIYARFVGDLCRKADEKYNSGIFHFKKEEGVAESPDALTPKLQIDDRVFKPILQSLYFENGSPYHFGVLPVEILGTVYERFLGKVIRLTADHRAKVEEKPEVRKAGGVYYTPAYIVDYIVKNTVGKMIEGRSPAQLAGGKNGQPLRVLDMACGSGSFLLGAYQCLLDHCLKWYLENRPEKHQEAVYFDNRRKFWRLTITEKKRILISHIFGVDIDLQAVEVSKLSLLLKVLEGETDETVGQSRQLFHERALPNLSNNIKCGNSLIGPDYFSGRLIPDPDEMKRVNPFDWNREFPDAMKSGGFDCVIGNPPYGRDILSEFKDYFEKKYETQEYKVDSFVLFIEQGQKLLNKSGKLGQIVPNSWLNTEKFILIRKFLLQNSSIDKVVNLGKNIFVEANIDTMLIFIGSEKSKVVQVIDATDHNLREMRIAEPKNMWSLNQKEWESDPEYIFSVYAPPELKVILTKLSKNSKLLGELVEISQGLIPYNTKELSEKNPYISSKKKGADWQKLLDKGACVGRYSFNWNGMFVKFGPWLYTANQTKFYENDKILIQRHRNPSLSRRIVATYDEKKYYYKDNLCGIISNNNQYCLKYILGILNSTLINQFYKNTFTEVSLNPVYLKKIPIASIDFSNNKNIKQYNMMSELVASMLELQKRAIENKSIQNIDIVQRQIDATDHEIDRLVYELYGLTEDEIEIVEEKK